MDTENKKYRVVTLGCRTNQYESQAYATQLDALGWERAEDGEEAALCIVNSCTVTQSADSHSRHQIRQLARQNPGAKLVVTGCMTESSPKALDGVDGVSLIVPNKDKEQLIEQVFPDLEELPEFSIQRFDAHTRAFVKVQDGCNSFCTYCIIPYVRGRSRSRAPDEIVEEVKSLVANGYKEVVITGINVGDYDGNPKETGKEVRLAELIRLVDAVPGIERVRVSSIDPDEVDDDLQDAILNGKHTCKSMHIVLQAGSNVVLKRMNRKYTRQMFFDTVERLTQACPDFTVTTDIIVGFPGETEQDFEETLEVMRRVQFAKVHMFPYSDRPRTRASTYNNKVTDADKKSRKQQLLRLAEHGAYALRERFVGRRMTILTESRDENRPGEICGHTDNFLMVWVPDAGYERNQILEVELTENTPDGLKGRVLATEVEETHAASHRRSA